LKYQDLKIRDTGRMALLALGMALIVGIGLAARTAVEPLMHGRYMAMLVGIAIVCPITVGMCIYYLCSTPAQNARFIRWSERHRWGQPPLNFDWTLLDPSDPDFNTPTFRYWLAKKAARSPR
jgi:hypothetical protein